MPEYLWRERGFSWWLSTDALTVLTTIVLHSWVLTCVLIHLSFMLCRFTIILLSIILSVRPLEYFLSSFFCHVSLAPLIIPFSRSNFSSSPDSCFWWMSVPPPMYSLSMKTLGTVDTPVISYRTFCRSEMEWKNARLVQVYWASVNRLWQVACRSPSGPPKIALVRLHFADV